MADIASIVLNFNNGTSATVLVSPTAATVETPFGRVNLAQPAPRAPSGPEIASNPGLYDGDPASDPTLGHAPQFWEGEYLPPYPPNQRMCDMARADIEMARAVWKHNLGAPLDESKLTPAQRKRCGL